MNPSYAIGVFVYKHEQDASKLGLGALNVGWIKSCATSLATHACVYIHTTLFPACDFCDPQSWVGWFRAMLTLSVGSVATA